MEKTKTVLTRSLVEIGIFSAVVNLLLLVQPIYLLQVYDRILPASSISTLVYLSIMVVAAMAVLGLLEVVRSLYANRMAARIEATSGSEIFLAAMNSPRAGLGDVQPLRDMSTIRSFVASRAMFFLFDLPFAPLFIRLLYFVHPVLFVTTIVGAVGTILAESGINISSLELSRLSERGEAMMFVSVDDPVDDLVLERIRSTDGIVEARVVELPTP